MLIFLFDGHVSVLVSLSSWQKTCWIENLIALVSDVLSHWWNISLVSVSLEFAALSLNVTILWLCINISASVVLIWCFVFLSSHIASISSTIALGSQMVQVLLVSDGVRVTTGGIDVITPRSKNIILTHIHQLSFAYCHFGARVERLEMLLSISFNGFFAIAVNTSL